MNPLRIFHTLLILLFAATCLGAETVEPDSVWYDSITGIRTHLQRTDTLTPHSCALHFWGKKPDGTAKLPGLQALVEDLSINGLLLSYDYYVQHRVWARVSRHVIENNLTHGWVWDNDSFSGNQFAHPFHGSMFYNTARQHGLSYGVSLLYPLAGSITWELFCETNRPAYNDLLSTGIGGSAFGEVTHRVSDIFFDNSKRGGQRVLREIVGTLINPIRGIHRMMSGEMFHVDRFNAGKQEEPMPYTFLIGFGDRYIYDHRPVHPRAGERYFNHVPYLDFHFNYGEHFNHLDDGSKARAFDYFTFYALVNFSSDDPTVGEFDIRGRIGSLQQEHSHNWNIDLGFYQNIKYIDHYSKKKNQDPGNLVMVSEAVSFGAGLYAEHQGKSTTLSHDLMLSAVPLGGSSADYYPFRRYNYGTGASLRYRFQFTFNRHLSVGEDLYFMRLFILKGETPEKLAFYDSDDSYWPLVEDGIDAWGDKGENSIFQNRLFCNINLFRNVQLHLQHEFNFRHGNYRYYPSVTSKSHEWNIGLSYAL